MANASNIIIGTAAIAIDGQDIGFTMGGLEFRWEPTFREIEADQAQGVVKIGRISEKAFLVVRMLEVTLARLRQAFNQPSANLAGSTLLLGYNNACAINEHQIVLTGVGPDCEARTWTLFRAVSIGNVTYAMSREEETVLEVEFQLLKNDSGAFGYVAD